MYKNYNKYYKSNIKRDETEDLLEVGKLDSYLLYGIIFAFLIIPIIIGPYISEFISPLISNSIISSGVRSDIFSFYKFVFLIITTIGMLFLFIYKILIVKYKHVDNLLAISWFILTISILLSLLFAPYKSIALFGMFNRYEGTLTYICYLFLFFIALNISYNEIYLKRLLYSLYLFVILNATLVLLNFYGIDVLSIGWIKSIFYSRLPEGVNIGEGSNLLSTLSNPNYLSGAGAIIWSLFLTWSLFDENKSRSLVNLLFSLMGFVMVICSLSTSGFLTILIMTPIILLSLFKSLNKKKTLLFLSFFIIGAILLYLPLVSHNSSVWDETIGNFVSSPDNNGNTTGSSIEEKAKITNNEYELPSLPKAGLGPGTGRIYIWEKTFELVKKKPVFGYGLDTLAYFFPQDDPEKNSNLYSSTVIVDKPHNIYINILYGSGIIALLSFLVMICYLLFKNIKNLFREKNIVGENVYVLAILLSCIAYLIQGLFNDSVIGTSVIFWVFLGVLGVYAEGELN